jgi:hypothetical protein
MRQGTSTLAATDFGLNQILSLPQPAATVQKLAKLAYLAVTVS